MLIAQITDLHITHPDRLAYGRVATAPFLAAAVAHLLALRPRPDIVVATGDLVDRGTDEEYAHLRALLAPLDLPLHLIPGNHDDRDALRRAFPDHTYLPPSGFLHYVLDHLPLRIVALDSLVRGQGGGRLCPERLDWVARALAQAPDRPTLVLIHHPPFATGISHMDRLGLEGAPAFAAILARHPQVVQVLCGHLHRPITARIGGTLASTAPSVAHQVTLDLDPDGPSTYVMEPPGYQLHLWRDGVLTSHTAMIGPFPGPFDFWVPEAD